VSVEVLINEVGPRDGLQNQQKILSVDEKHSLISAIANAGVKSVEVGAFVSPKAVPAMAGTDSLVKKIKDSSLQYSVLIPNMKGFELAYESGARRLNLVVASSNTMNEKNIRMNTEAAMKTCIEVIECAGKQEDAVNIQAYVATAWECPFEGKMPQDKILELTARLIDAGVSKVVLADTVGGANPQDTKSLMDFLVSKFGNEILSCHFHDTRAMGLANIYAALTSGIREFDASIAGLGGCPFSPGASGNVATEDVVMMLHQMGYKTGINLEKLLQASDLAMELTGSAPGGRAKLWLKNYLNKNYDDRSKI